MIATVVGKRHVDYTSSKTGRHVVGTELHTERPAGQNEEIEGKIVEVIFTRMETDSFEVDHEYEFVYDNVGRGRLSLVDIREVA